MTISYIFSKTSCTFVLPVLTPKLLNSSHQTFLQSPQVSANTETRPRPGSKFHTNHCIMIFSTQASSWCFCSQKYRKGLKRLVIFLYFNSFIQTERFQDQRFHSWRDRAHGRLNSCPRSWIHLFATKNTKIPGI